MNYLYATGFGESSVAKRNLNATVVRAQAAHVSTKLAWLTILDRGAATQVYRVPACLLRTHIHMGL